ncbi:MAG TPA: CpaF family protein [Verrucomicrobiae bacterium]|jgi:pilus assembly protein CpaF|nr:CpaF family protein [Verrucomicrobiae bacterium]
MPLSDRLRKGGDSEETSKKNSAFGNVEEKRRNFLQEVKIKMHRNLIDRLNLEALMMLEPDQARKEVGELVRVIFSEEKIAVTAGEREEIIQEVVNETFGLGPLEPLLADPNIDEILVNNAHNVFVEKHGKLVKAETHFKDDDHLRHIISRIVARVGRRIDESSPMVDARLADGSRVNAVIPPLALDGPVLSIRRFKKIPFRAEDLIARKSATEEIMRILEIAVKSKLNILVSGGTGSGKTTVLNILSSYIPSDERIITIEDAAELQLQQGHVVRLETRPANLEGRGQVTQRDLVKNALRMRPDRIVVGEVRGEEALDMLQAMNTGHEGSITTVHANSPRDAVGRIETMVLMANSNLIHHAIIRQIGAAFHLIVQIRRFTDGVRRVESVTEVTGMEGDVISLQEVFSFQQKGVDTEGNVIGEFTFHDIRPKFLDAAMKKVRTRY